MLKRIFTIASSLIVFVVVYLLGRFKFSVGWLLPLVFQAGRDFTKRNHEIQRAIRHGRSLTEESDNERDLIFSRLDEVPAWVMFPDVERVEWLNSIVKFLWPKINGMIGEIVKDLEVEIKKQAFLGSFKFKTVNLGRITPRITGIKVHDKNVLQDDVIVELNFSYFGDAELMFSFKGIDGGIKNLELEGTVRITLKHLIPAPPLVCGIEISFMKCPTIDFTLLTALAPLDMFASGDLLRAIITEELNNRIVYPNKIYIKLKDVAETKVWPEIDGIVHIAMKSVDELVGFDDQNVCAKIELGAQSLQTHQVVIRDGTANIELTGDLIKYTNDENCLSIAVNVLHDDENVNTLIGSIDITNLNKDKSVMGKYPMSPSGSISTRLCWHSLSSDRNDLKTAPDGNSAILEVFIDSARKLPKELSSVLAQLSIGNQVQQTEVLDSNASTWKKYFVFFIQDPQLEALKIKLVDRISANDVAQFVYNIPDLMARKNMEHKLHAFPLTQGVQDCEILMSIRLRILKSQK